MPERQGAALSAHPVRVELQGVAAGEDLSREGLVELDHVDLVEGQPGPVQRAADSVVEDSWIGPYTAIGRDCTVRDSRVADSILLDHVTVVGVHGLHGSLVGRRAQVAGAAEHRLLVGDDTSIEVAA